MSATNVSLARIEAAVVTPFEQRLNAAGLWPILATRPTVLQMNLGYRCNQSCPHCHLQAGPHRREQMGVETIAACLQAGDRLGVSRFDLTGGAPELHPHFRSLVGELTRRGHAVTDRSNLTVLLEPGQEGTPALLARHRVSVVASLPCYTPEITALARGPGVFERSLAALRRLNAVGYGHADTGLQLTLVHNPAGPYLPGDQGELETAYRNHLADERGIVFSDLITITNMPLGGFLDRLTEDGELEDYMAELSGGFNPTTVAGVMCRTTLSVGWDGAIYDCDFNQSIRLPAADGPPLSIGEVTLNDLVGRPVCCASHCYGCTAGSGSSCTGALV